MHMHRFGKHQDISQDTSLPTVLKRKVRTSTLTSGCQTWTLNKQVNNKLQTTQRAMERKRLNIKLQDKISVKEISKKRKITDVTRFIKHQKWRWAGHIARLTDKGWTKRCREWQPRE